MAVLEGTGGGGRTYYSGDTAGRTYQTSAPFVPPPPVPKSLPAPSPAPATVQPFAPMPVRPYAPQIPPLSAGTISELNARRRAASRALEEAMARRESGRQEADVLFERLKGRMGRQRDVTERDLRGELAGRGLAFMPRFMGKGLRDVRDAYAESVAEAQSDRASKLGALEEMVRQARSSRDEETAAVDADESARRREWADMIRAVGY